MTSSLSKMLKRAKFSFKWKCVIFFQPLMLFIAQTWQLPPQLTCNINQVIFASHVLFPQTSLRLMKMCSKGPKANWKTVLIMQRDWLSALPCSICSFTEWPAQDLISSGVVRKRKPSSVFVCVSLNPTASSLPDHQRRRKMEWRRARAGDHPQTKPGGE